MKPRLKILYNKYVIAILIFLGVMLFFDQNDYFTQRHRQKQLQHLEENINFLHQDIERLEKEINDLNNNNLALETYAREHYFEKKANEDVYVIIKDTVVEKK